MNANTLAYAGNDKREDNPFPQPGQKSGRKLKKFSEFEILRHLEFDGFVPAKGPQPRPGYYLVALAMEKNGNYLLMRQDSCGAWSYKNGVLDPSDRDWSGRRIFNPESADRGPYERFIGYFLTPKGGLSVGRAPDAMPEPEGNPEKPVKKKESQPHRPRPI